MTTVEHLNIVKVGSWVNYKSGRVQLRLKQKRSPPAEKRTPVESEWPPLVSSKASAKEVGEKKEKPVAPSKETDMTGQGRRNHHRQLQPF